MRGREGHCSKSGTFPRNQGQLDGMAPRLTKERNRKSENFEASYTRPSLSAKTSKKLAGKYFFCQGNRSCVHFRRGNCRETRRAKKRASSLFPRRESQIGSSSSLTGCFLTRNSSMCMLRNPRLLRIKNETRVKVAFVMEITHFSSSNRLKSANRLLTNFYLTRKHMRLAKPAPRV